MRSRFYELVWIVLCSGFLAGDVVAEALPEHVQRPPFKVGDYWVYNKLDGLNGKLLDVTSEAITKIDDGGFRLAGTEGYGGFVNTTLRNGNFNLTRVEGITGYPKGYVHLAKPYYPHLAFPLFVGKSWKQKVDLTWSSAPDVFINFDGLESKVVGWQMVTVPAGNFMALKIETNGWNNGKNDKLGWSGKVTETQWFSPDARNVVRSEYMEKIGGKTYKHEITELQGYGLMK